MNLESLSISAMVVVLLSCSAGVGLWERYLVARFLPLIASIAMGLAYFPLLGVETSSRQLGEMLLGLAIAGAALNLAVWLGCRETKTTD